MNPFMKLAFSLARRAVPISSPNPPVGAVLVRDGEVVGRGFTQPPGREHAEIVALKEAGERARGAALFVTLEPCPHYGRTPPCTEAIIRAGVREVHMACLDPNPIVMGRGKRRLEEEGIRVYIGEGEREAKKLYEAYSKYITKRIPFVILKFAMSLDGKLATKEGSSRWISGERARRFVHSLRWGVDAILVGVRTILADDPELTARRGRVRRRGKPIRVILDAFGKTPPDARIFKSPNPVIIATANPEAIRKYEGIADIILLEEEGGYLNLSKLLEELGKREIMSLLVEGGGEVIGSFLFSGLADKAYVFVSPIFIGGRDAVTVGGEGVSDISRALRLEDIEIKRLGDDILFVGYVHGNS